MFRFDLHVHSHYSADACDSPGALVAAARGRGLDGIAITDHDTADAHAFCLRRGLARPDGQPVDGFLIVPGIEISTSDGHLLCLGTCPTGLAGRPALEVCEAILAGGGVPVPAHPFDRWRSGIRPAVLDVLPIMALETFNAAVTSKRMNEQAGAYARSRGLASLAGSDAHHASAVGVSSTAFEMDNLSVTDLVAALPKGGEPCGGYLSLKEGFKKHFANFFRRTPPERG